MPKSKRSSDDSSTNSKKACLQTTADDKGEQTNLDTSRLRPPQVIPPKVTASTSGEIQKNQQVDKISPPLTHPPNNQTTPSEIVHSVNTTNAKKSASKNQVTKKSPNSRYTPRGKSKDAKRTDSSRTVKKIVKKKEDVKPKRSKINKETDSDSTTTDSSSTSSQETDDEVSLKEQVRRLTKTINDMKKSSARQDTTDFHYPSGELFNYRHELPQYRKIEYASGLLAGDNIPDKVKQKIWDDKYVDFYDLLYPDHDHAYSLSLHNTSLELVPRKKRTLNQREWNTAFDDYFAVYVRKYPNEITELLSYSKFIKELMEGGSNWAFYDLHYRKDREFTRCKWSTIRMDLQIKASRMRPENNSTTEGPSRNRANQIPRGYCYKYHGSNTRCYNRYCNYKHNCFRCDMIHPATIECHLAKKRRDHKEDHNSNRVNQQPFLSRTANPSTSTDTTNSSQPTRAPQINGGIRK